MANSPVPVSEATDARAEAELKLLLEWPQEHTRREWLAIVAGTIAVHVVLFGLAIQLNSFVPESRLESRVVIKRTPLYVPRDILTQRAPNRGKLTKQIDLASLLASTSTQAVKAARGATPARREMPKQTAQAVPRPKPVEPKSLPEPPKLTASMEAPTTPGVALGQLPPPIAPPPPAANGPFQNIQGATPPPVAHPTITPPKNTLPAVIQGMAHDANSRRLVLNDDTQSTARPGVSGTTGQMQNQHAGVELQSDPEGADLRPYLAQILAIVRRNWRRVMPESAVIGKLRGRTVIEFAVDRDGRVVKLVVGDYSGSQALDQASVAGLSMSNPLPPLPADYKGLDLRLAFTFAYNMATQ